MCDAAQGSESVTSMTLCSIDAAVFWRDWRERWDSASPLRDNANPFLQFDWLECWWSHFGDPGGAEILINLDGGQDLTAALFTRRTRENFCGFPVRSIRCWVNDHCHRAGLVVAGCDVEALAASWLTHWERTAGSWDVLRLHGVPSCSRVVSALAHEARAQGYASAVQEWDHTRLVIDRPWRDYFASIRRKTRNSKERTMRRLEEIGQCAWRKYSHGNDVLSGLELFIEMEQRSWKARRGEIMLHRPNVGDFYRDLGRRLAGHGRFEVDLLFLDQRVIGGLISLSYKNRLTTLKISFDQEFARYSPGWILLRYVVEDAFARQFDEIDFYAWKPISRWWSKDTRRFHNLLLFSPAIRGRAIAMAKRLTDIPRGRGGSWQWNDGENLAHMGSQEVAVQDRAGGWGGQSGIGARSESRV